MQVTGVAGGPPLWAEKDKDSILNYTVDLAPVLSDGDRAVSCNWDLLSTSSAAAQVVVEGRVVRDTSISVSLSGGSVGVWWNVTGTYRTEAGVVDQVTVRLFIKADAEVLQLTGTALFPNRYSAAQALRRDRLGVALRGVSDPALLTDDYLWSKLQAAESQIGRGLGIFLQPTEVFSVVAPPAEVAALGGLPHVVEPAYDLPPDFFKAGQFGSLKLNHPLVSKVTRMELVHPSLNAQAFVVPSEWVLLVGRAGFINVLPGSGSMSTLPLSLFTLQAMGSGYTIPQMVRVRYTAGLERTNPHFAEVVDLAWRAAVLGVLADAMVPQSGSISADGLSQSQSQDVSKHQDALDAAVGKLRERIVGLVWGVL